MPMKSKNNTLLKYCGRCTKVVGLNVIILHKGWWMVWKQGWGSAFFFFFFFGCENLHYCETFDRLLSQIQLFFEENCKK